MRHGLVVSSENNRRWAGLGVYATMHPPLFFFVVLGGGDTTLANALATFKMYEREKGLTNRSNGIVEHRLEPLLGQRRALQVLHRANILGHGQALLVRDRGHSAKRQSTSA